MQLTNRVILESKGPLTVLMQQALPVKAAHHLARAARKIENALKDFTRTRDKLLNDLGTKDPETDQLVVNDKGEVQFDGENKVEFEKKVEELLDLEVDVDVNTLSFEKLGDDAKLPPAILYRLNWLFSEE